MLPFVLLPRWIPGGTPIARSKKNLRSLAFDPPPRIVSFEPLYEEPTAVVCGPRHPLARHWDPESVGGYSWMLPSDIAPLYALVSAGLAQLALPPPKVLVETSSVLIIAKTLPSTDLLSAIPLGVANDYAGSGQLAVLPIALSTSLHPVCVMTAADQSRSTAVDLFIGALRDAAREFKERAVTAAR